MDTTYFMKISHAQAAMKASDEIYALRQRVAELEAVLRECRDVFVKNIIGSGGRTQAMHEAILKIDEVLNENR